ncbi:hypothetical protein MIR68_012631 [Amoeboaphelidium protococcarum]|nr:hypothetical protein MIR68_012631 [Amoeboaphelidium protococcarum]
MLIQKKGIKGAAANYITRTRAVRKLQISLSDFRKLCILKGIYPREPKSKKKAAQAGVALAKAKKGATRARSGNTNNTFYYVKDIQHLLHEPVLHKLRERHAFVKKIKKAIAKRDFHAANILENNEPVYTLHHLVKERYPTFTEALMDLDDCLCHVFMFATLPLDYGKKHDHDTLTPQKIENCQRLCNEFMTYVIKTNSLQSMFCSIKGYYYRAIINGTPITWLVPHEFTCTPVMTSINSQVATVGGVNAGAGALDVDMRVMLTFLEFYECMLGFVNFRLFSSIDTSYPLEQRELRWTIEDLDGEFDVNQMHRVHNQEGKKSSDKVQVQKVKEVEKKISEIIKDTVEGDLALEQSNANVQSNESSQQEIDTMESNALSSDEAKSGYKIFSGLTVKINREVPRKSVLFMLLAHGANVILPFQSAGSSGITHEICDRPLEHVRMEPNRKYVQPQWVFDSINQGKILSEDLYAIGKSLPPHLSPFYDYVQSEAKVDDMVVTEAEVEKATEKVVVKATAADGSASTDAQNKLKKNMSKEEREMAKMLMSNKKRKFLEQIEKSRHHQQLAEDKLAQKRAKIAIAKQEQKKVKN